MLFVFESPLKKWLVVLTHTDMFQGEYDPTELPQSSGVEVSNLEEDFEQS